MTDTNQASEDELDTVLRQHREWMRGIRTDRLIGTSHAVTKAAIQAIIRTEKLRLLAEAKVLIKAGGYEASYEISMIEKLEAEL